MKKLFPVAVLLSVFFGSLSGCSTLNTTILPHENNRYTVIATAQDRATTIHGAVKKAAAFCLTKDLNFLVLKRKTVYQGAGKELGALTRAASQLSMEIGGVPTPSTETQEDYETRLLFRCVK